MNLPFHRILDLKLIQTDRKKNQLILFYIYFMVFCRFLIFNLTIMIWYRYFKATCTLTVKVKQYMKWGLVE